MNDFAFVAIMLAFFVLAWLFVGACDRIVGADEEALPTTKPSEPEEQQVAA